VRLIISAHAVVNALFVSWSFVMPESLSRREEINAGLDYQLPSNVEVGPGTALFVAGWCFARLSKIVTLDLTLDGDAQPTMAHAMPRLDLYQSLHPQHDPFEMSALQSDESSGTDPFMMSYRSGFWGILKIPSGTQLGARKIGLLVTLEDGSKASRHLTTICIDSPAVPIEHTQQIKAPRTAIAMATFNPTDELFRRQIESIKAQTETDWVCFISDDCSNQAAFELIERITRSDPRFVISRSPTRLGFYRNFERALAMTPTGAEFVAMADQDDYWHDDNLTKLIGGIGDANLIYSDARIVDADSAVIAETYWSERENNHSDLISLLTANSVTGAASLIRRDLLDRALPFPPNQFAHFHDHWIALVALSLGEIRFIEEPLYDYTQHGGAVLGHAAANRNASLLERFGSLRRNPRQRVGLWRNIFFVDGCRLMQFATVLEMRCGPRMSPAKRRLLNRFLSIDSSTRNLLSLAVRGARDLAGKTETLGAERGLFYAFAWRRLLTTTTRSTVRPHRRLRLDALPPTKLDPQPGLVAGPTGSPLALAEKIEPLRFALSDRAPQRVNILIPTIDLNHFFGGYIAKFNLALALSRRGRRVRIITVDPVGPLPELWREQLERYSGLDGVCDQLEIVFGREAQSIEISSQDCFIATTWWTAHIAHQALKLLAHDDFLYLIQEYEPFTFPMGSYSAIASQSYDFAHNALFSSELLRAYFRIQSIGVYAGSTVEGDRRSVSFENAITPVAGPTPAELAARSSRRLLVYARPEPHAARNMFELAILALRGALDLGAFADGWELNGIGGIGASRTIDLGGGALLKLLPRSEQNAYSSVLPAHDVGLALMYTPHPSLVPIEMASAGLVTVTNSYENKTARELDRISSNLLAAAPTIESISRTLVAADESVDNFAARSAGSNVAWSRSWEHSFGAETLAQIETLLSH
jgi:glycosyltransferase involved in cell wall biosynthesis